MVFLHQKLSVRQVGELTLVLQSIVFWHQISLSDYKLFSLEGGLLYDLDSKRGFRLFLKQKLLLAVGAKSFIFAGMMCTSPIGIFDSGVGGTSIWKEIHKRLPAESTYYPADSKNAPYGTKDKDKAATLALSIKNTEYLLDKGCKLIVVACNTATTNAIAYLGILATEGTLSSALFHKTADLYGSGTEVIEQNGEGLVPLVEAGV